MPTQSIKEVFTLKNVPNLIRYPLYLFSALCGLAFAIWAFIIGSQNYVMTQGNCQIFALKSMMIATGVIDMVVFLAIVLFGTTAAAFFWGKLDEGIFVLIGSSVAQNTLLLSLRFISICLLIAMSAMFWSTSCVTSTPSFYKQMNYYLIIYWCVYFVIDTIVLITAIILTTFTTIKQAKLIKKELEEEKQLYGRTLLGMQSASDDVEMADLQSPKYNLDGTPKTPADRKSLAQ